MNMQGRPSELKSGGAQQGGAGNFRAYKKHFSLQKTYLNIYYGIRGGADRNPRHWGVDLDRKPTLGADLTSEAGGAEKVVVHVHPQHPLDGRP